VGGDDKNGPKRRYPSFGYPSFGPGTQFYLFSSFLILFLLTTFTTYLRLTQHYYVNLNESMCSLFKLSELVIISCLLMPLT
jgi:hypothetical protein